MSKIEKLGVPLSVAHLIQSYLQNAVTPRDIPVNSSKGVVRLIGEVVDNGITFTVVENADSIVVQRRWRDDSKGMYFYRKVLIVTPDSPPLGTSPPSPEETHALNAFPRIWSILACAMPRKLRDEVFVPAQEELKEDFLRSILTAEKPSERRMLGWIFSIRMMLIYCQSAWAGISDRVRRFLQWLGVATAIEVFRHMF